VPMVARWPGTIKPGTIVNEIFASEDWMPTLLAAAGDPEMKQKLLKGVKVGDKVQITYTQAFAVTVESPGK